MHILQCAAMRYTLDFPFSWVKIWPELACSGELIPTIRKYEIKIGTILKLHIMWLSRSSVVYFPLVKPYQQ